MNIVERFVEYAKIDTQSNPKSATVPSTEKQKNLGNLLVKQLKEMGIENAHIDEKGYVYAHLKSNVEKNLKKVGFIAHMDTATELTGANVNPQFVDYKGGDIKLNDEVTMTVKEFPCLNEVVGERLITTDGNTLLGADDKSGIAIIMDMVQKIISENLPHGDISIGFTPDEEIGRGADCFDVKKFGADFAYTIDGGPIGELEYESFNACSAVVDIKGKNVHPGSAKDIMRNSLMVAHNLLSMLPANERPEHTEGYEGFHHLHHVQGTCEKTRLEYIVRDHNFLELKDQLNDFKRIQAFLNSRYGYELVHITMHEQYLNMKDIIKDTPEIVEQVEIAMNDVGLNPTIVPIRGGTDGAMLSYKGLPCPNLGTGGFNCHGPFEFVSITMMKKGLELLLRLIRNNVYAKEDMPF